MLKLIVTSPYLNLIVGIIMIATSFQEAYETLYDDLKNLSFGAHHGLIVYGLLVVVRALPDIFEGLTFLKDSSDQKNTK